MVASALVADVLDSAAMTDPVRSDAMLGRAIHAPTPRKNALLDAAVLRFGGAHVECNFVRPLGGLGVDGLGVCGLGVCGSESSSPAEESRLGNAFGGTERGDG